MPAVKDHRIDGIVTNWGNPLPGFNDQHEAPHRHRVLHLGILRGDEPAEVRQPAGGYPPAIDELSGDALVTRFGLLWNKWDQPVRDGASGPGQEIIVPDEATLAQWHDALRPAADRYLDTLSAGGFSDARAAYDRLISAQR